MSAPDPRFVDFLAGCTRVLGLPDPTVASDSYMFQVDGRWIELKFNAAKGTVTTAAIACVFSRSEPVRTDLVASFNLRHLFDGGHALAVDERQGVIRLCRTDRLAARRYRDIRSELAAFARLAAIAGTWYLRTSDETEQERPVFAVESSSGNVWGA